MNARAAIPGLCRRRGRASAARARPPLWRRLALRRADSAVTGSNLLQTAVTVLAAIAVTVATLVAGNAAGAWQQSVREEVKRSAAMVEDLRHVYGDEAPVALEIALAEARARAGNDADALTERQAAFAMRLAQSGNGDSLAADRYLRPGGWYDVPRRLADVRSQWPALVRLDPDRSFAAGDRRRDRAALIVAATVPLVALYLLAELVVRVRPRRRRPDAPAAVGDVGLVPRPWSSPSRRRFGAAVALVAWLLVVLLSPLQLRFDGNEQRSGALAARMAAEVSRSIEASGLLATFQGSGRRAVRWLETRAEGRLFAASNTRDARLAATLGATSRAEKATSPPARAIVTAMTRAPSTSDGVDPATVASVRASPATWTAVMIEQNRHASETERASRRGDRVEIALLLAALTLSLCALAAANAGRRPAFIQHAAVGVLVLSLLAAASIPLA
jgi:hypothetical protein